MVSHDYPAGECPVAPLKKRYSSPMTTDMAPDIARNYPSGGERIGPAWVKIWKNLSDGKWKRVDEIMEIPDLDIVETTVHNLLSKAEKKKMLQKRMVKLNGRNRVQYRFASVGMIGE